MLEFHKGTLFAGRYEIIRCIGSGGMGAVYLACDPRYRNFQVALKVLYPGIIKTAEARERFRTEIVASYRINHRNIVRAYEYFDESDAQAYAMEYVEGGDLLQHMQSAVPLSEVISILRQSTAGLGAIHAQGIVHRDLKPENIMLTKRGVVKIADFGVARLREQNHSITQAGAMVGTPKYLPPEYIESGECDHRGDLYALGVIGYELVAGQAPFKAQTRVSIMVERFEKVIDPLTHLRPECSRGLEAIIHKALSVPVEERYQSTAEMEKDLSALEAGEDLSQLIDEVGVHKKTPKRKSAAEVQPLILGIAPERANTASFPRPRRFTHGNDRIAILASLVIMGSAALLGLYYYDAAASRLGSLKTTLPDGTYSGFVTGGVGYRVPIKLWGSSDGSDVFLKLPECIKSPLSVLGQFICDGKFFKLKVETVRDGIVAGTLESPEPTTESRWIAIRNGDGQ